MILFLDFDGVLHPHFPRRDRTDEENQLFSYLSRLESVLRDSPEWKIVISSSWRENRPWANVIQAFSPDIAGRILGATPVLKVKEPPYPRYPRHNEVMSFLEVNGWQDARWLALDDDPALYPPDCESLILCEDGFRETEEVTLREALKLC